MMIQRSNLTVAEWESVLGDQVRAARIAAGADQATLAAQANVSVGALAGLERGTGSSLKTLIAVARALGRSDWLETFAPAITVSPLQMLRAKQSSDRPRRRVR